MRKTLLLGGLLIAFLFVARGPLARLAELDAQGWSAGSALAQSWNAKRVPASGTAGEVRGSVVDSRTRSPIADARIEIVTSLGWSQGDPASIAKTRSDARGAFRVRMPIGQTTSFASMKRGYLYAGGCRDPHRPVEILMTSIPPDPGRKVARAGILPAGAVLLDLERGVVDVGEDIRVEPSADGVLTVVAAPGRTIQWRPEVPSTSGWSWSPLNSCEAPADGYVASFSLPPGTPRGLCFVRRDAGPAFGGFSLDPEAFFKGEQPATQYRSVLNRDGGRGLCTEEKTGWAGN